MSLTPATYKTAVVLDTVIDSERKVSRQLGGVATC